MPVVLLSLRLNTSGVMIPIFSAKVVMIGSTTTLSDAWRRGYGHSSRRTGMERSAPRATTTCGYRFGLGHWPPAEAHVVGGGLIEAMQPIASRPPPVRSSA